MVERQKIEAITTKHRGANGRISLSSKKEGHNGSNTRNKPDPDSADD